MTVNVLLADDHALVRQGLRAVLEMADSAIRVCGEASNGNEVLKLSKSLDIDVYILDISMPELNGIETMDRLMLADPDARGIILSMHDSRTSVERAFAAGAKGYVLKESAVDEVVNAIHEVHNGCYFLSPRISQFVVRGFLGKKATPRQSSASAALTRREREIIQLIVEGNSNKDIARKLHIAMNTVHVHRNNLMRKLDIHKQTDLVRYAIKEGISYL
jgi:DNA-binding NarL/FixJ family response regulator